MKKLTTICLLFALVFACNKSDNRPPEPPGIEGHWVNLTDTHPDWQYLFDDNILTQYIVDFGDTITSQQYTYATRHDTIIIGGDINNPTRQWQLNFICDSVVIATNITPGTLLAPTLYLRKLQ